MDFENFSGHMLIGIAALADVLISDRLVFYPFSTVMFTGLPLSLSFSFVLSNSITLFISIYLSFTLLLSLSNIHNLKPI